MITLKEAHLDELLAHTAQGSPNEICGMLAGREGVVTRVLRGTNVCKFKGGSYELDPLQQLQFMRDIEEKGESLLAIYHSHPNFTPYPSGIDTDYAYHPDCHYIIVSLGHNEPEIRAFLIVDGKIWEQEIQVVK